MSRRMPYTQASPVTVTEVLSDGTRLSRTEAAYSPSELGVVVNNSNNDKVDKILDRKRATSRTD